MCRHRFRHCFLVWIIIICSSCIIVTVVALLASAASAVMTFTIASVTAVEAYSQFYKTISVLLCVTAVNVQSLYIIISIIYLMLINVTLTLTMTLHDQHHQRSSHWLFVIMTTIFCVQTNFIWVSFSSPALAKNTPIVWNFTILLSISRCLFHFCAPLSRGIL